MTTAACQLGPDAPVHYALEGECASVSSILRICVCSCVRVLVMFVSEYGQKHGLAASQLGPDAPVHYALEGECACVCVWAWLLLSVSVKL